MNKTNSAAAVQTSETQVASSESESLLQKIMRKGRLAKSEQQKARALDLVSEFVNQLTNEGMTISNDCVAAVEAQVARIDELISAQLNEILHHPDVQKLEASWRGLHYLVSNTETSASLKLRVLNVSKRELQRDLESAVEFDQSHLFRMVYEDEFGTFGGTPCSLMVGDFEFGRHPQDIALLTKISAVAAAAHAPFIAGAAPQLFDLDSFTELGNPRDLSKIFESSEMAKWRAFRASEDARYAALVLPHILLRAPYEPADGSGPGFQFAETIEGGKHSDYLWGNAAYAMALRITTAFAQYGWCAAIRGVEGGGLVEDLPAHTFKTGEGDVALKCPTEVTVTDRREKELDNLGFIGLCYCKGTDYAAFFGAQTAQKPKVYANDKANANAALSARLPYVLAASRFAHYLKVICRDKVGSFQTKESISAYLNEWIAQYVLLRDNAEQGLRAKYPLREARVDVTEVPGRPGSYRAVVFLRPHYQLEELTASIRLVAELPAAAEQS
jgi:type VI secretion system protein ImpC